MSLKHLFAPRSIAVIGASTKPGSVGNDVARNLVQSDYTGDIFLINPKTDTLFDRPCYPSISALPHPVDLALIIVPAKIVPTVLREVGKKQVPAAVIISAGFKESGAAGQALEAEVVTLCAAYHITLLGPNCLGFISPSQSLNASFASSLPAVGSVAFFSQSGALTSALLDLAKGRLGFSLFASIGNKAATDEAALLDYLLCDETTRTIGFYTENLSDSNRFITLGRRNLGAAQPKPIVALKSGQTDAGSSASSSHTGAVAGSDSAYDALFRQAKMFRAQNFEELVNLLLALDHNPVPRGKRLAIVTNAGGLGVLATDAAIKNGLALAALTPTSIQKLKACLPPAANTHNPIDILGDALAERYSEALQIIADDETVDLLLIILTPQTMTEAEKTAEVIVALQSAHPELPITTVFSGAALVQAGHAILSTAKIPNFLYPESGARALAAAAQFGSWQRAYQEETLPKFPIDTNRAREVLQTAALNGQTLLGEPVATKFLAACGFPLLESRLLHSEEEAVAFAKEINAPLALKIASPDIIHKSDVGGVRLGIKPENARAAYKQLLEAVKEHVPDAMIDGVMGVQMALPGGRELLLGLKKEPGLGTLVVCGLGGIYVETFKDISMRFAPLLPTDIDEMLSELRSLPLLLGTRGEAGIDVEKLKEYIARLSLIAVDFPEIEELDINPLLTFPLGSDFRVIDARLRITAERAK